MPLTLRGLAAVILGLVLLNPGWGTAARAQDVPGNTGTPACSTPLTLSLQPGEHWPGAASSSVPDDLPPGPLPVSLPLYPGAALTDEQEQAPNFDVPADPYMKSASTTYEAGSTVPAVMAWYRAAFAACGYARPSVTGYTGNVGKPPLSYLIGYEWKDGRNTIDINLSFEAAKDGGTLILYVVIALTPPDYPVAGSVLRVPGMPVAVRITRYNGWNPGPHESRPVRTVDITDAAAVAGLADEINHVPKVTGTYFCAWDDNSHITLVFTDAGGSQHVVRIDLRGCVYVHAPPAALGRLFDDPHLLPRVEGLLNGTGSRASSLPFDARTLRPVGVRRLAGTPSRFLSAASSGQNGAELLYLSGGKLFVTSATSGSPRLLARGIGDAAFTGNPAIVLARLRSSTDLRHLLVIDTRTGERAQIALPRTAVLVGPNAGAGASDLADALQCYRQDLFYRNGRTIGGIDPDHPTDDRFAYRGALPRPVPGEMDAIGCSGSVVAVARPGHKLLVFDAVGVAAGEAGRTARQFPVGRISFLSWAPDEEHLAYRVGPAVSVVDIRTGRTRQLLQVGRDAIHGATWDPWSKVLAISVSSPGAPTSAAHVVLANISGRGTGRLALPFTGASRLEWSVGSGTSLGITRVTARGTQAWAAVLPGLPPDPGDALH